jgi:hypothetical protein
MSRVSHGAFNEVLEVSVACYDLSCQSQTKNLGEILDFYYKECYFNLMQSLAMKIF